MSSHLRDHVYAQFCDALATVAPTSPTLCDGWDAHDLAVHIWVIKHDPLSWPGIVIPAFAGVTLRRAERNKRRWSYAGLVEELRQESGSIACMPLDGMEGHRHALGEYYIHTEDIRRPNGLPRSSPAAETEDALWLRARTAGRQLWGRRRAAVHFAAPDRNPFSLGRGVPTSRVSGLPSEVILWIYGREGAADVDVMKMST